MQVVWQCNYILVPVSAKMLIFKDLLTGSVLHLELCQF